MPSGGGGFLMPRSEQGYFGAGVTELQEAPVRSKPSKPLPRSEVLNRSKCPLPAFAQGRLDDSLREDVEADEETIASTCGPEFFITVDRSEGRNLGIEVEHYTDRVLIVMSIAEGLIQDWNSGNPDQHVEDQDLIVGANDVTGNVERILSECKKNELLKLALRRPAFKAKRKITVDVEYRITLDKTQGARLGIDVNHEDGKELSIESIEEGLVEMWNKEHPDKEVLPEDRIIEVNGVRGEVSLLLQECKQNIMLEVTLVRSELREPEQ